MLDNTQFSNLLSTIAPDTRPLIVRFLDFSEQRLGSAPKAQDRLMETLTLSYHLQRRAN